MPLRSGKSYEKGLQNNESKKQSHKAKKSLNNTLNLATHSESGDGSKNNTESPKNIQPVNENLPLATQDLLKSSELIKNLEEKLRNEEQNGERLRSLLEKRTEELNISNENQKTLKNCISVLKRQIRQLTHENTMAIASNEDLNKRNEEIMELRTELERKQVEFEAVFNDRDQNQSEISSLSKKTLHLEQELRVNKQESQLVGESIQGLNYELDTLKAWLNQERQDADVLNKKMKLTENLKAKLTSERMQISNFEENQEKAESCISGLTLITIEQKQKIENLQKDINTRDQVIDKLTNEYEKVMAKVRRYRSMREQYEGQGNGKGVIDTTVSALGDNMIDNDYAKDSKSIPDLMSGQDSIKKDKEIVILTQNEYNEKMIISNGLLQNTSISERTGDRNDLKDEVMNIEMKLRQLRYESKQLIRIIKSCKQLEHILALKEHENDELTKQISSLTGNLKESESVMKEKARRVKDKERNTVHNQSLHETHEGTRTEVNALKDKIDNLKSKLSQHRYERNLYYDRGSKWKASFKQLEQALKKRGCASCKIFSLYIQE